MENSTSFLSAQQKSPSNRYVRQDSPDMTSSQKSSPTKSQGQSDNTHIPLKNIVTNNQPTIKNSEVRNSQQYKRYQTNFDASLIRESPKFNELRTSLNKDTKQNTYKDIISPDYETPTYGKEGKDKGFNFGTQGRTIQSPDATINLTSLSQKSLVRPIDIKTPSKVDLIIPEQTPTQQVMTKDNIEQGFMNKEKFNGKNLNNSQIPNNRGPESQILDDKTNKLHNVVNPASNKSDMSNEMQIKRPSQNIISPTFQMEKSGSTSQNEHSFTSSNKQPIKQESNLINGQDSTQGQKNFQEEQQNSPIKPQIKVNDTSLAENKLVSNNQNLRSSIEKGNESNFKSDLSGKISPTSKQLNNIESSYTKQNLASQQNTIKAPSNLNNSQGNGAQNQSTGKQVQDPTSNNLVDSGINNQKGQNSLKIPDSLKAGLSNNINQQITNKNQVQNQSENSNYQQGGKLPSNMINQNSQNVLRQNQQGGGVSLPPINDPKAISQHIPQDRQANPSVNYQNSNQNLNKSFQNAQLNNSYHSNGGLNNTFDGYQNTSANLNYSYLSANQQKNMEKKFYGRMIKKRVKPITNPLFQWPKPPTLLNQTMNTSMNQSFVDSPSKNNLKIPEPAINDPKKRSAQDNNLQNILPKELTMPKEKEQPKPEIIKSSDKTTDKIIDKNIEKADIPKPDPEKPVIVPEKQTKEPIKQEPTQINLIPSETSKAGNSTGKVIDPVQANKNVKSADQNTQTSKEQLKPDPITLKRDPSQKTTSSTQETQMNLGDEMNPKPWTEPVYKTEPAFSLKTSNLAKFNQEDNEDLADAYDSDVKNCEFVTIVLDKEDRNIIAHLMLDKGYYRRILNIFRYYQALGNFPKIGYSDLLNMFRETKTFDAKFTITMFAVLFNEIHFEASPKKNENSPSKQNEKFILRYEFLALLIRIAVVKYKSMRASDAVIKYLDYEFFPFAKSAELEYTGIRLEKIRTKKIDESIFKFKLYIDKLFNTLSKNNDTLELKEIVNMVKEAQILQFPVKDAIWCFAMSQQICIDEFMGSYTRMSRVEFYEFLIRASFKILEKDNDSIERLDSLIATLLKVFLKG